MNKSIESAVMTFMAIETWSSSRAARCINRLTPPFEGPKINEIIYKYAFKGNFERIAIGYDLLDIRKCPDYDDSS